MSSHLRKTDWFIADVELAKAQKLVRDHHYARGGSNTAVYTHGLFRKEDPSNLCGIAWWLPPTRVAAESVNRPYWQQVLCLSRLVILPGIPTNAASFLLAGSRKKIEPDRWKTLVTYADERQGHKGTLYLADNWSYIGRTGPYPAWIDPTTGRQVARKATKNRTKREMQALGYVKIGSFYKHKYTHSVSPRREQETLISRLIRRIEYEDQTSRQAA